MFDKAAIYENTLGDRYTVKCTGKGFKVTIEQSDGPVYVKRFRNALALDRYLEKLTTLKLISYNG